MYPLSMSLAEGIGYAVANDEAEHKLLTAGGYIPPYAGPPGVSPPDLLPPEVSSSEDKPKRGRPRKAAE